MTTDNMQHGNLYERYEWKPPTQVAGVPWKNPVATASGTFQYAAVRWFYDVSQLGAVTTKGVSPVPWEGNPGIRTAEGPSSNINAVGLQNPGVDHYLEDDLPKLKAINANVIANVAGHCDDDYAEVVAKLNDSPADMLEINVSCPNVSAGGMSVGTDPVALSRLITRLRKITDKKMIVKLTPNVTDITVPARAAVESGADALLDWLKPYEQFTFRDGPEPDFIALHRQIGKSVMPKTDDPWGQALIDSMVLLIKEELHHFWQVREAMLARNIPFFKTSPSRYAKGMLKEVRTHEPLTLIDKLICGAYIEARSCERFAALAPIYFP